VNVALENPFKDSGVLYVYQACTLGTQEFEVEGVEVVDVGVPIGEGKPRDTNNNYELLGT
jgi:hypothetical protein